MLPELPKYTEIVLSKCLGLKKEESLLIVTDYILNDLANEFLRMASAFTDKIKVIEIPVAKVHGTEPSDEVSKEMLNHDVELLITSKSLSHTNSRINASKKGARIVTMPGITKEVLMRTIDIDYDKIFSIHSRLGDIIDKGKEVSITTELGTDLVFSIDGRKAFGRDAGLFTKPGSFGNLPTGEIFTAPVEGTANGRFIVDASFGGIGILDEPLKLTVKDGFVIDVDGKKSKELYGLLNPLGKNARNIAEFGIGTNNKAKITGNTLEDEKVLGTCHIALGNNIGFGGNIDVKLHLDGIIKTPTIAVDGVTIEENGRFLF
jgi:aminopeptidase